MPPVHGAPLFAVRVVLKKQMVLPLENRKPIGVIDPACGRRHVKYGPFLLGDIVDLLFLHSVNF